MTKRQSVTSFSGKNLTISINPGIHSYPVPKGLAELLYRLFTEARNWLPEIKGELMFFMGEQPKGTAHTKGIQLTAFSESEFAARREMKLTAQPSGNDSRRSLSFKVPQEIDGKRLHCAMSKAIDCLKQSKPLAAATKHAQQLYIKMREIGLEKRTFDLQDQVTPFKPMTSAQSVYFVKKTRLYQVAGYSSLNKAVERFSLLAKSHRVVRRSPNNDHSVFEWLPNFVEKMKMILPIIETKEEVPVAETPTKTKRTRSSLTKAEKAHVISQLYVLTDRKDFKLSQLTEEHAQICDFETRKGLVAFILHVAKQGHSFVPIGDQKKHRTYRWKFIPMEMDSEFHLEDLNQQLKKYDEKIRDARQELSVLEEKRKTIEEEIKKEQAKQKKVEEMVKDLSPDEKKLLRRLLEKNDGTN